MSLHGMARFVDVQVSGVFPIFVTNSYFQNRYLQPRLGPWLKIPIAATFSLVRLN
jgi:hypothetical protein